MERLSEEQDLTLSTNTFVNVGVSKEGDFLFHVQWDQGDVDGIVRLAKMFHDLKTTDLIEEILIQTQAQADTKTMQTDTGMLVTAYSTLQNATKEPEYDEPLIRPSEIEQLFK